MAWNYVDILLIVLVLLGVAGGWQRGFLHGMLGLLGWVGGLLLALRFYQPLARLLGPAAPWPDAWDRPAAFVLILLAAGLLVALLRHALSRRLPERVQQAQTNRVLGMLPGLLNGLISAAIVAALLLAVPFPEGLRAAAGRSGLASRMAVYTERLEAALTPIFADAIGQTLNTLTIRPESDEVVDLPFTVADARPLPDLEAQMLDLVNQERAAVGLSPLQADPELTEVARRHSADMLARGYFAHVNPEGLDPFDRIRAAGIPFLAAGENLALAPTLSLAHTGLMNSPGHRANILHSAFGRVGIGIMDGGPRGLMVTQNFRD